MASLKEMRDELRELRKEHPEHKPVSKMRKADISSMIQKLKVHREETAMPTATAAPAKAYKSAVESVKEAKTAEFPLAAHADAPKAMKSAKPAKKSVPVAKARAEKGVVVSERADTAAKKPKGKKHLQESA
jgi:hypothetical protein